MLAKLLIWLHGERIDEGSGVEQEERGTSGLKDLGPTHSLTHSLTHRTVESTAMEEEGV